MIPNPQLEGLIARETYAELLACLTPGQLAVVALRLEDLRYDQVAELLGLTRQCVYARMKVARQRLVARTEAPGHDLSRARTGAGRDDGALGRGAQRPESSGAG